MKVDVYGGTGTVDLPASQKGISRFLTVTERTDNPHGMQFQDVNF